jgi:Ca-activated chloride channel family protein
VLGCALALAQPRWGASEETVERQGVDVVFLLDSSLSMAALDVPPSRLFVAKSLVRRLAQAMPGNRLGLIQAEGEGDVLAPLTLDAAVIDLLLDTVEAGSLPTPGTELAPAFDTALKLFGEQGEKHRVLIVLSDGEDHGGGLDARISRLTDAGVVVHALGIGTPQGAPLPLGGDAGGAAATAGSSGGAPAYKRDDNGDIVISRLDEEALEQLARKTGGSYRRVTDAGVDLAPLVAAIDRMEKRTLESRNVNSATEHFQWPLALAAAALLAALAVGPFADRRATVR